jgi:hypothetical protein
MSPVASASAAAVISESNEAITSMTAGRLPWGKDHHRVYRTLLYRRLLIGVACEDLPEEPTASRSTRS